jgi:molybdopterin-guanine dinucleotide biosynthesis protein A
LGGGAKGLERVGRARIIDRVADALRGVTSDLLLVANAPDAMHWLENVPVAGDRHPGGGGLAGVEAALERGRDALVVAWDMPFVTVALLRALLDLAVSRDADAVFPRSASPHGFEPFCGFYSARLLPRLTRYLDAGGGAAHDFIARVDHVHFLSAPDVAKLGDADRFFLSVNSPSDLERARAIAARTE